MRTTFLFSLSLLPFLLPEEDCYNHNSGLGLIITNFSKHVGTRHGYKTSEPEAHQLLDVKAVGNVTGDYRSGLATSTRSHRVSRRL